MTIEIFHGHNVRIEIKDNKAWFNNSDVCAVLGSASPHKVIERVKEAERNIIPVRNKRGEMRDAWFISERGLIRVLQTSRSPLAEPFQDWADERIEQLMKGKTVNAAGEVPTGQNLLALAVLEAQKMLEEKDREIATLKPKADGYDTFLDAKGSVDVQHAAQLLTRAGIKTGQKRLFNYMDEIKWTSNPIGRSRRAMQTAVDSGYVELKAMSYKHPRTGEVVVTSPQIRITPKGLHKLRELLLPPLDMNELF